MTSILMAILALSPAALVAQAGPPAQPSPRPSLQSSLVAPVALPGPTPRFTPYLNGSGRMPAPASGGRVSTGVTGPRLIHKQALSDFKTTKLSARPQKVVLFMVVDERGTPRDLRIMESPDNDLSGRVLAAVNLYRYSPGRLDGIPVAVPIRLEVYLPAGTIY